MGGLVSVVLVGGVVAYLMYQNINQVTSKIEKKSSKGYEFFANLAGAAIEFIKDIKRDINGKNENPEFSLQEESKKEEVLKSLDDFIRKLAFYETVLAKKKDIDDIESEIAEIFINFDEFIKANFKDGEIKADNIRESLHKIYQNR
jgi:O-methyltransferase involved in polyketide biosynthesis